MMKNAKEKGHHQMTNKPILTVSNFKKYYKIRGFFSNKGIVKAVDDVSFELARGETLSIVGESGCGKSTLAKLLMDVEAKTAGKYILCDKDRDVKGHWPQNEFHKTIQMIFQDPYSSLNPRKKAWQIVAEPLFVNTNLSVKECRLRAMDAFEQVGLRKESINRYPHMFSGGQRQRIGIARALVLKPKVLICDEPVSALDVSVQAQVLNLLMDIQEQMHLSLIFISHDLSVVKHISDRVLVMYLGRIAEIGRRDDVFQNPLHPYTKALLASRPQILKGKKIQSRPLKGELPSPMNPPSGCIFHLRCPKATDICKKEIPILRQINHQKVACHHAES